MKKLLAGILSAALVAGMVPMTVFAADGPSEEQWQEGEYLAAVSLYGQDNTFTIFSNNTAHNDAIEGASYDRDTNTLTLKDFKHPELSVSANMMGDDFTINVEGECSLSTIICWGFEYGNSLMIDGTGSLTVNKDGEASSAIYLQSENSDSRLGFGSSVTVDLYSTEHAASVVMTTCDDADKAVTTANGEKPAVTKEKYTYEEGDNKNTLELYQWGNNYGYKVIRASDPDGLYGASHYNDNYDISHYYNVEEFNLPIRDYDFPYTSLTEEQFEASEYSFVYALQPAKVLYSNAWSEEHNRGIQVCKVTKDSDPDTVYGASLSWTNNWGEGDPDTYIVYKLVWDETENIYRMVENFPVLKLSAEQFAENGYSLVKEEVVTNVKFRAWFDEDDAKQGESEMSNYDLVKRESDPEGIYIKYGTYTSSENGVQTDAGYLIRKPYYSEEYGGYLTDHDGSYGSENFEISYNDFDNSEFSFVTEAHIENVNIRYITEDYTFENYAYTGDEYKKGDQLYIVGGWTKNGEPVGYYVYEITFDEAKGHYMAEELGKGYTFEEFEAEGFEPVMENRKVEIETDSYLSRNTMSVAVDQNGNNYLYPGYGNYVYNYTEDNTVTVNGDKFYVVTKNTDVSSKDITVPMHTVETDMYCYYITDKEFHYSGTGVRPLFNNTTVNASKLSLGSRIWITRGASGGDGNYTYEYYYKRHTARLWTKMNDGLMTADGAFFTPRAAADFDIKAIVKDGAGQTAEKILTVSIVDGKSTAFQNNSYLNRTEAKPNTRIIMTGSANGSAGYKYAFYYKRSTASVWTRVGTEFGDQTTGAFTPRSEGVFFVKIDIIDENNELVSKNFDVRISNSASDQPAGPVNNSTISATEITAGTMLTINGAAAGGTGAYTYTYEQKKSTANRWNVLGTANTTATSERFTPRAAGTINVRVTVTDSSGASTVKTFNVTVS